jgi:hypothetical protein
MVNNSINIKKTNNHLQPGMVNNSHQRQQSEKSPLSSDGQQFTSISVSEQSPLNSDGQQFHQYQQNKQSPPASDDQQFTSISTTRAITSK